MLLISHSLLLFMMLQIKQFIFLKISIFHVTILHTPQYKDTGISISYIIFQNHIPKQQPPRSRSSRVTTAVTPAAVPPLTLITSIAIVITAIA